MEQYLRKSVRVRAPAKLNLVLDVLRRRRDGYHDVRSLMTPISLYDEIVISGAVKGVEVCMRPARGLPRCRAAKIPAEANLATRAADFFFNRLGRSCGCRVEIIKRIPIAAGLGGGSADGAGVLLGLNALFDYPFSTAVLSRLGASIGCDIPPLVWGGPVWISGKGDRVTPIPRVRSRFVKPVWLVLLNPGFPVATSDIYRRWIPGLTLGAQNYKKIESVLIAGDVRSLADCLWNNLQTVAFAKYPALELLRDALREAGAVSVLLAGSGGSIFGLAASRADALRVRRRAVECLDVSVWSRVVRTMPDGVMVAHGPLEARV